MSETLESLYFDLYWGFFVCDLNWMTVAWKMCFNDLY